MRRAALLAGGRGRARLGGAMRAGSLVLALLVSGCIASTRNPERLIPVAVEMDALAANQTTLINAYDDAIGAGNVATARTIRNEIITRRMYAIDVQYTQYENALTREGQEIGFGALTAATGLSSAATLVAANATKTILSAAATGVLATKGHYESQVLIAQTIRTIQKQMRSSRNGIATGISGKMAQSVTDYPLWAALSDVEDYYNAGTLTTGVIDVSTTVGNQEQDTKEEKQGISQLPANQRAAAILRDANTPIPKPFVLPVTLNPLGVTEREKKLTPRIVKQMQRVVCLGDDGFFTVELRTRAIAHLNSKDPPQKSASTPNALTDRDVLVMQNDADANVKSKLFCQS